MTKANIFALAVVCLLLLPAAKVSAREISLAWNANPEQDVAGYKVYYRPYSPSLPFDGIEANEGASPIDVGDITNFSLSGLAENRVYYFAVVAYNSSGVESTWSDIIASSWVPGLIAPDNGAQEQSSLVRFIWESAPAGHDATFTLYYGTDPNLAGSSGVPPAGTPSDWRPGALVLLLLLFLCGGSASAQNGRRRLAKGVLAVALACSVTACGGDMAQSGGGDTAQSGGGATVSIYMDKTDYYEAFDLQPGTTYYWKVVAIDSSNPQMPLESITRSFTSN